MTLPLPMPEMLPPAVDPRAPKNAIPAQCLGVPLRGNGWIAILYLAILALNIASEAFWWRR